MEQDLKEKVPEPVAVWVAAEKIPVMKKLPPEVRGKTAGMVGVREKGTDHKEVPEY